MTNVRFWPNEDIGYCSAHVQSGDGKTSSRRCRRGRPVLQEPVLGTADGERRNCTGVRRVLSEVPEALKADIREATAHVCF